MPSPLTRWGGVLLACLTAVAVAACGSSTSTSSTAAPSAATTATTAGTTTAATRASTSTTSASSQTSTVTSAGAASASSRCTSAHTAVSVHRMGVATGHAGLMLRFRNTGSALCTLTGYPGVNLVTAHGHQLQVPRTPQGFMGGLSPQAKVDPTVRLAPGGQASAVLEGEDFKPKTGGSCPRYSILVVTPPNDTRPFTFTRKVSLCDPQIHPVVSGTSGRQGS